MYPMVMQFGRATKISFKLRRIEEISTRKHTQTKKTFKEWKGQDNWLLYDSLLLFLFAPKWTDLHGCQIANCPVESERRKVFLPLSHTIAGACWGAFIFWRKKNWIQLLILWYIQLNGRSLTPGGLHYHSYTFSECSAITYMYVWATHTKRGDEKKLNERKENDEQVKRDNMWSWWKMRTSTDFRCTLLFWALKTIDKQISSSHP